VPPSLRFAVVLFVKRQQQVGNFHQAFSHLTLIGAATSISAAEAAAKCGSGLSAAPTKEDSVCCRSLVTDTVPIVRSRD
jgi:hypothetical protein